MAREKAGGRKTKTRGVEKRKKGIVPISSSIAVAHFQCPCLHFPFPRPQCAQARTVCVHVLCQRAARECPGREPRHLIRYVVVKKHHRSPLWPRVLTVRTGQVGKILGERWKALNDKQREPYEAKAAADKKRYEEEKAAYNV